MTTSTPLKILPTTVVGSYPQPAWLVDHALLAQGVPRTRLHELWRIAPEQLQAAQDDATRLAIQDMERAGIEVLNLITDYRHNPTIVDFEKSEREGVPAKDTFGRSQGSS